MWLALSMEKWEISDVYTRSFPNSGGSPSALTSHPSLSRQYRSRAAMRAVMLDWDPPEVKHPSDPPGRPNSPVSPWTMLSSSSVAAGPWSQLSMLSLKHDMISSEHMVSVSTGEWRCGM